MFLRKNNYQLFPPEYMAPQNRLIRKNDRLIDQIFQI